MSTEKKSKDYLRITCVNLLHAKLDRYLFALGFLSFVFIQSIRSLWWVMIGSHIITSSLSEYQPTFFNKTSMTVPYVISLILLILGAVGVLLEILNPDIVKITANEEEKVNPEPAKASPDDGDKESIPSE